MLLADLFRTPGSAISPRRKTGWIGIDIGTAAIKIAQLQQSGAKRRLVRSVVIRADEQRPFDLAAFESGFVGTEIKRALQVHGGFHGQSAACVVSMAARIRCTARSGPPGAPTASWMGSKIGRAASLTCCRAYSPASLVKV